MRYSRDLRARQPGGRRTLTQQALAILRSYGASANLYLPGVGTVNGITAGNFLDSSGTTPATVDNPIGLLLSAGKQLGPELVTNGDFSSGTAGWSVPAGWSVSAGGCVAAGTSASLRQLGVPCVPGKSYRVEFDWTHTGGTLYARVGTGTDTVFTTSGRKSVVLVAAGPAGVEFYGGSASGVIDNITVRQLPGINLTQPTTANKPVLRRGIVNWLLNGSSPATQGVTVVAGPHTLAMIGTGSVAITGTGSGTLSGAGAGVLSVLTFTPTAGTATFTPSGSVSSFALFRGTLTVQQIIDAGGIPTTTTAAASSATGAWAGQFDGNGDLLQTSITVGNAGYFCAGAEFAAGRANYLFYAGAGSVASPGAMLRVLANGVVQCGAGDGVTRSTADSTPITGSVARVYEGFWDSSSVSVAVNGITTTQARSQVVSGSIQLQIGGATDAGVNLSVQGNLFPSIVITAATTSAQRSILRRFVASLSGVEL